MMLRYFSIILCCAIFAPLTQAQNLRKWTNNEGQSFTGSIVDCDGVVAKYKIFGRKNLFELPLSELRPEDRPIAILSVFKPKYETPWGICVGSLRKQLRIYF